MQELGSLPGYRWFGGSPVHSTKARRFRYLWLRVYAVRESWWRRRNQATERRALSKQMGTECMGAAVGLRFQWLDDFP